MKKSIDYLKIIKDSAKIIWKKKVLMIFGFFVLTGSLNSFVLDVEEKEFKKEDFLNFIFENQAVIFWLSIFVLMLLLVFIFLRAVGIATLIKFSGGALYEKKLGFRDLFGIGKTYALRIIAIEILSFVAIIILFTILSVPIIFLVMSKIYSLAFLIGIMALIIIIPVLLLVYFIKKFSYVFLVLSEMSIRNSIEKAYFIFRGNIFESIILSLLLFGTGLLLMIISVLVFIPIAIVVAILGTMAFLIFSKIVGYVFLVIGIFIFSVIFILAQSFLEALKQSAWTLFVKEIAGVEKEEKEEKEIVLNAVPKTEQV